LAKKNNIETTVSFILQPQAVDEKKSFIEKWRRKGVDNVTFYVLTEHEPSTGKSIRLKEFYTKERRYPCSSPWEQSVVFPEGEVSLCCKTLTDVGWKGVISVGNLNQSTFEEIWHGKEYNNVRKEVLKNSFKKYKVCEDCFIWSSRVRFSENKEDYVRTYNETIETFSFKK
jgi:hypothetical protein